MQKLKDRLKEIRDRKKIGLMTHVVVGYPSLEDTRKLVKLMEKAGVDIVELQIPFSDPLADGPTIMRACEKAISNGVKIKDAFSIMKQLSSQVKTPLLFMAYYNTVFKYGTEKFCADAKKSGAEGVIVPDVPIEEEHDEHFIALCKKYNLANVRIVSPSSTEGRLKKNAKVGSGFVYCTARQGITGAKASLDASVTDFLKRARKHFSIPLAVGFGISKREHVEALKGHADIAIIGSAFIDVINESKRSGMEKNVSKFLERMIH